MAYLKHATNFPVLSADELAQWEGIPAAVIADCMNRTQSMVSAIKSLVPGRLILGQARTVSVMAGDCGCICIAAADARPGEVIVVDAGGVEDTAVWGGVMTQAAVVAGLGGVVIDGAARDLADIEDSPLAIYCRGVVPRGPHQGFGGDIDGTISAGGVAVASGDLVIGDKDGVVVVPLARANEVLAAARAHIEKEKVWIERIMNGETIPEIFEMHKPALAASH